MTQKTRKNPIPGTKTSFRGLWYILFFLIFFGLCGWGFHYYQNFFQPNVTMGDQPSAYIYIHTGADFSAVKNLLSDHHYLRDMKSFEWVAQKKKYDIKIRPGRYKIRYGMNNNELVNLLRSGKQEPVRVILQNVRTPEELAGKIASQIEGDSISILNLLRDPDYLREFGAEPATIFTLFIPNTYEFLWNTTADHFIRRMYKERQKFWNDERLTQMSQEGLNIPGVITLASILEKETAKNTEKSVIAGVYLNRIRKSWPLQADPTLIFAWNDYTIKRVLNKHKEIDSPYNTYKYTGLPPGPICLPSVSSIDAVLNYEKHGYMYLCAKDDLSGYHNFAVTLAEHNRNAERYQAALKRLNVH
ncbi:MAG TPA: endolytic transglycosylase MltG [Bacteroidales bacterium]|nr:endolytic transglycosylase MltG [Bacteroidales bacterium]